MLKKFVFFAFVIIFMFYRWLRFRIHNNKSTIRLGIVHTFIVIWWHTSLRVFMGSFSDSETTYKC